MQYHLHSKTIKRSIFLSCESINILARQVHFFLKKKTDQICWFITQSNHKGCSGTRDRSVYLWIKHVLYCFQKLICKITVESLSGKESGQECRKWGRFAQKPVPIPDLIGSLNIKSSQEAASSMVFNIPFPKPQGFQGDVSKCYGGVCLELWIPYSCLTKTNRRQRLSMCVKF